MPTLSEYFPKPANREIHVDYILRSPPQPFLVQAVPRDATDETRRPLHAHKPGSVGETFFERRGAPPGFFPGLDPDSQATTNSTPQETRYPSRDPGHSGTPRSDAAQRCIAQCTAQSVFATTRFLLSKVGQIESLGEPSIQVQFLPVFWLAPKTHHRSHEL